MWRILLVFLLISGCAMLDVICPSAKYGFSDNVCFEGNKVVVDEVYCNSEDSCNCRYTYKIHRYGEFGQMSVKEWDLIPCDMVPE